MMTNEKTDKLEKFVQNNREAFETFEPPTDLFAKIAKQVETSKKPKGKKGTLFFLQRAAAAIIILLAAYGITDIARSFKNNKNRTAEAVEQNAANNELGEAMLYYTTKINNKRTELEGHAERHPEILEEIKLEFTDLDEEYQSLENDLKEDISNQMVIEAMIRTAKIKLEILEEMNSEMNRIDEKKNENNEKTTQL